MSAALLGENGTEDCLPRHIFIIILLSVASCTINRFAAINRFHPYTLVKLRSLRFVSCLVRCTVCYGRFMLWAMLCDATMFCVPCYAHSAKRVLLCPLESVALATITMLLSTNLATFGEGIATVAV